MGFSQLAPRPSLWGAALPAKPEVVSMASPDRIQRTIGYSSSMANVSHVFAKQAFCAIHSRIHTINVEGEERHHPEDANSVRPE